MKETQVKKIVDSDVSAILTRNINLSRQTATGLVEFESPVSAI